MQQAERPRTRVVSHTARDARVAVSDVVGRLEPYRSRLAVIAIRASKPLSHAERHALRAECVAIKSALQESRIELLDNLIEAPQAVSGHSRVADVERALDNLEEELARVAIRL